MSCKNCGHQVIVQKGRKEQVAKLFNGQLLHKNVGHQHKGMPDYAPICRTGKCGCLKPEIENTNSEEVR